MEQQRHRGLDMMLPPPAAARQGVFAAVSAVLSAIVSTTAEVLANRDEGGNAPFHVPPVSKAPP